MSLARLAARAALCAPPSTKSSAHVNGLEPDTRGLVTAGVFLFFLEGLFNLTTRQGEDWGFFLAAVLVKSEQGTADQSLQRTENKHHVITIGKQF